jgi:hypothetical protein
MEIALLVFVLIALIVMFFMNKRNQNNASSRELLAHLNSELRKEIQDVLKLTNGQEGEDFSPMMIENPRRTKFDETCCFNHMFYCLFELRFYLAAQ